MIGGKIMSGVKQMGHRKTRIEDRKVTKIGNSLGVTMTEALKQIGANQGDSVLVEVKEDEIVIRKNQQMQLPPGIDPKFLQALQRTKERYNETLKGLRDR